MFITIILILLTATQTAWATITGNGTQQDPYIISSKADWNAATQDSKYYTEGVYVELGADIDFGNNDCRRFGNCTMHFDGKGHTIRNFKVDSSTEDYVAPFTRMYKDGTISNLTIASSTLTGNKYVAGIVAINYGTVSNCHVESTVTLTANQYSTSEYCGGIAACNGWNNGSTTTTGTITNCIVGAKFVLANRLNQPYFGGIVGRNYGASTVSGCLNYSTYVTSGNSFFKSIIGDYNNNYAANITNNYYRPVGGYGHGAPSATVVRAVSGIPSGVTVSPAVCVSHGGYDYIAENTTFTLTVDDPHKAFNDDFSVSGTGTSYTVASNKTSATVTIASDDATINASLRNFTYTVVFNGNGSTSGTMNNQAFEYSIAQNLTANAFSRTGYTFAGWSLTPDPSPSGEGSGDLIADQQSVINLTATDGGTVNLYAKWTANTYTVHFDKNHNDATGSMSDMPFTYDIAQTLTANAFSRTHYDFAGWNTQTDGNGNNYSDQQSVENLTATDKGTVNLYAQWTLHNYTISYDLDGGSADNPATYTVESNDITLTNPTRTGYVFTGWTGTGLDAVTMSVTITHGSSGNRSYAATWEPVAFSVRFNGNGATSGTMSNQGFAYDMAQLLTANAFGRAFTVTYNYNDNENDNENVTAAATFNGWATTAEGAVVYADQQGVSNLTDEPNGIVDLYANWTDASVTLPTPTRTGYTFMGWYSDADLTDLVADAGASYTPSADISLYAKWVLNTSIDVSFTSPMTAGDDAYITVTMTPKDISIEPNPITTVAKVYVDTKPYLVPIVNGVGTCIVTNLAEKSEIVGTYETEGHYTQYITQAIPYDIQAVFDGDDQYLASTSEIKQLTVEKIPTTITISVDKTTANVGEPITVTIDLEPKIDAIITFWTKELVPPTNRNNHTLVLINGHGTKTFSDLPALPDPRRFAAIFAGDDRYANSRSEIVYVTINKAETTVETVVSSPVIAK